MDRMTLTVQALIAGALTLVAVLNRQWPLLILIVPALGLVWLVTHMQREQRVVQAQMRLELHAWLMRQFGLPFTEDAFGPRPPSASHVGTLKSHHLLREQLQEMPPNKNSPVYQLSATLLVVDEQNRYWLALYNSERDAGAGKPITQPRPPVVLPITELRARRALFNDPPAYQKAFGQAPTRAGLDAWRAQHPEQDQLERERE